ncbi:Protein MEMO1 [Choanephora cucurbitarum]|uniref:Protein MEMO1 n=1 Tax=Choanephora cucurbitarum TaxID=101091 RepID=A0A1C7N869_9FUNG|nr:Protein MEMO1 [Choanephora cucurbitarum]
MKRAATHAGSWYTRHKDSLDHELDTYFEKADINPLKGVRAIIGPHAGLRFSGPTAAYAYKSIDTTGLKRVFILGPSHHAYIDGCSLSKCLAYKTPLGELRLDRQVIEELHQTGHFDFMSETVDHDEHSIEMHLPYVYKIFESLIDDIQIVPILVGSIRHQQEKAYGELLAPYLNDPQNLFIISSDFCHWGTRFNYTYYRPQKDQDPIRLSRHHEALSCPIHESIKDLDLEGIHLLKNLESDKFQAYLTQTRNTICGRHPIGVLMAAIDHLRQKEHLPEPEIKCVHYEQSSQCKEVKDSSVSYASIYFQFKQG